MPRQENGFKMFLVISNVSINMHVEKNEDARGAVIAADYVELGNIKFVATTSNNTTINFWDSSNYISREKLNTSEI